ncbi:cadherin domain-containing protein [Candidatus Poriferisodalis sp.]|uniref:cadherin domain-containing protein n=1 Tax=Candidatus Poriferisodalis sp. TaxID=3101277 RepID=UPI003B016D43
MTVPVSRFRCRPGKAALAVCLLVAALQAPIFDERLASAQTTPAAPTITGIASGDQALTVAWNHPSGVVVADVTAYDLRLIDTTASAQDKADPDKWVFIDDAWTEGSLLAIVTSLVNETTYDVQVRAVTSSEGTWSAVSTGTPRDPGSSASSATALVGGLPVRGVLDAVSDRDTFSFQISGPSEYYFLTSGTTDTQAILYDSNGARLHEDVDGGTNNYGELNADVSLTGNPHNFEMDGRLLTSGTYYLEVSGYGGNTGTYILHWATAVDTTGFDTASDLALNSSVQAVMHNTGFGRLGSGDVDYFKLELSATTTITVRASGFVSDTYGILYGGDGSVIAESNDANLVPSRHQFALREELSPGIYYISVRPLDGSGYGLYTLDVYESPEPGGSRSAAQSVGFGKAAGGTISAASESDYFRFELSEAAYVELVGSSDEFVIDATLQNNVGAEVDTGVQKYDIAAEIFGSSIIAFFGTLNAGTYYLKVEAEDGVAVGDYMVLLRLREYTDYQTNKCTMARSSAVSGIADPLFGCQWYLSNVGQFGGTSGEDINLGSVWDTYKGDGVNVVVVDDGGDYFHEDLAANVDTTRNHSYNEANDVFAGAHGTLVAGVLAARDNGVGVRGVAPRVTFGFFDMLSAERVELSNEADAMTRNRVTTSVSNNSWGPLDNPLASRSHQLWERAIETGLSEGAGGHGVVYVWAAGNGRLDGDWSSLDEYANYYGVIAACAVNNDGEQNRFTESGPNLWVCAPSGDTTPKAGIPFRLPSDTELATTGVYSRYESVGGTSAATPIVAGTAALLRDVDSTLSWRDVKLILAASARKNDAADTGWETGASKRGAAGDYSFNHKYGFGVVDVSTAVALAESWTKVPKMRTAVAEDGTSRSVAGTNGSIVSTVSLGGDVDFVEAVEVNIDFAAPEFRDLRIELESPSGAVSVLSTDASECQVRIGGCPLTGVFRFGSARHLGEDPRGTWTLRVVDQIVGGVANTVKSWELRVYGHRRSPEAPGLSYVLPGSGSLTVAWTAPTNPGTLAITGYEVRHIDSSAADKSDAEWSVIPATSVGNANTRMHTISGLTAGSRRDVQVRAVTDDTALPGDWTVTGRGTPVASGTVNSEPFFVDGEQTVRQVVENTGTGAMVGAPVAAQDYESLTASEPLTYSLTGPDAGSFALDASTGQLTTQFDPDFESVSQKKSYSVTVSVTDSKDDSGAADPKVDDMIVVTIDIVDEDEPPRVLHNCETPPSTRCYVLTGAHEVTFSENGTGLIDRYAINDPDSSGVDFHLVGDDIDLFDFELDPVSRATYALSFIDIPDFESPADSDGDNVYEVGLRAFDGTTATIREIEITVSDVDEPPTLTGDSMATVAENRSNTRLVFTAVDPEGDSIVWSVSGADGDDFVITAGLLHFASVPDFENPSDANRDNRYWVDVVASDGVNEDVKAVLVVVTDVSEEAVISGPSVRNFVENGVGAVGDYEANDPEEGEAVVWSLAGADASFFVIDSSGVLRFVSPPDREAARGNVYMVSVQASDRKDVNGDAVSSGVPDVDDVFDVTVTVTNVNEPPSVASGPVAAEVVEGHSGAVASFAAADPEGDSIVWSVSGTDSDDFAVVGGVLTFVSVPDFESPGDANRDNSYVVTVVASDGSLSASRQITVTVTDVSEEAVISGPSVRNFVENGVGAVGDYEANDPEEGEAVVWSLAGADASFFVIDSSGVLRFVSPPDREAARGNVYMVSVQASDRKDVNGDAVSSGVPDVDDVFDVTVTVTNVNEPPTLTGGSMATVAENRFNTGLVFTAVDPEGDSIVWSVSGADGDDFVISAGGLLHFASAPDFESPGDANRDNSYVVTVVASDGSLSASRQITVTVTNESETGSLSFSSVQPQIDTPFTATLIDPDGGVTGTTWVWERSPDGSTNWSVIGGASGRSYTPVTGDENHYLRATATYRDRQGGTTLQTVRAVSQSAVRANPNANNAPEFPGSGTIARSVPENSPAGSAVGAPVAATDADAADAASLVYTLGGSGAAAFDIDARSGQLRVGDSVELNHEARPSYSVTVTVNDPAGASDTQSVTVTVTDVDEAPVVSGPSTLGYAEGRTDAVATYAAVDPEGEDVEWSLTGRDSSSLVIDADSGVLGFSSPPDFDSGSGDSYEVTVRACDGVANGVALCGTLDVLVRVTDVDELPQMSGPAVISWEENRDATVGSYSAVDPEGVTVTWSLAGADRDDFEIDEAGGALRFAVPPDHENPVDANRDNVYAVTVRAFDGASHGTVDVTVTVTDVDEAPVVSGPSTLGYAEGRTDAVATYAAVDPEGEDVEWSLTGRDSSSLVIDADSGVLGFSSPPDFDSGSGDSYEVTVRACDGVANGVALCGTLDVLVRVTDVDELPQMSGPAVISWEENRDATVGSYSAVDPEGVTVTWSLAGADRDDFEIDEAGGALRFAVPPDHENPVDANRDNVYAVTVRAFDGASHGTVDVTVTVTDVDEQGVLELSNDRPGVGTAVSAVLREPDRGVTAVQWAWERASDPMSANAWTVIDGASGSSYRPVEADLGFWLRVTATYKDRFSPADPAPADKTLRIETAGPVQLVADPVPPPRPTTTPVVTGGGGGSGGGSGGGGGGGSGGGGGLDVGVGVFVLANGWSSADVGVASVLAARLDGGVVAYTAGDVLSAGTAVLLGDVLPAEVLIVGGTAAVSRDVRSGVRGVSPGSGVERVMGAGRAETAAAAARRVLGDASGVGGVTVVLANGWSSSDVGVAAALAARTPRSAVLYTQRGWLPEASAGVLRGYGVSRVVVVGGSAAVGVVVEGQVAAAAGGALVSRLTGADRVETAAAAARRVLGDPGAAGGVTVVVANGWSPPDVGVAAAFAAATGGAAVAYTSPGSLPEATAALIRDYRPARVVVVGGRAAVADAVRAEIAGLVPAGAEVRRVTGSTRIDTAARAARTVLRERG